MRRAHTYRLYRETKTKIINISASLILVATSLGGGLPLFFSQRAFAIANPANQYVNSATGTDSGNCSVKATPCQTITYALSQADNGTVIHVAAGTYAEQLHITESVRIVGAGEGTTIIEAPNSMPSESAIVDVDGSSVSASISQLTVEGPGPSTCGSISAGVFVENNAFANLSNMAVDDIRDNPLSGCQNGRAILIGWGHGYTGYGIDNTTGAATVNNVTVSDYQKAGIEVSGTNSSATIVNSTVTGVGFTGALAANGIEVTYGAKANVHGNTVSGNRYTGADFATGILLYEPAAGTIVQNNTVTDNQIGLWTDNQTSITHLNTTGISGNGRDAVADTTSWTTPPTKTYADSTLSGTANSDGNDIVTVEGQPHVWQYDAFSKIQDALNAVAANGRVYVANGTYHEDLDIPNDGLEMYGESQGGVTVDTSAGYGVNIDHHNHLYFENMTFNSSTSTSYALKAYGVNGLSLNSLTFNGPGKNSHTGGVDINSSQNVSFNNVSSSNYGKNGFAVTAKYVASDDYSRNITFNGVTASNNGWDGISFYTENGSNTLGHNITSVKFEGTNHLSDNGSGSPTQGGIYIEGDTDENSFVCGYLKLSCPGVPRYTVTTSGGMLVLGDTEFSSDDSSYDITNFQTAGVDATSATFNGKTGDQMDQTERQAEGQKILDQLYNATLGLVKYFNADTTKPTVAFTSPTPADGAYVNGNFDVGFTAHDDVALDSVNVSLYDNSDPSHLWQWKTTCYAGSALDVTDVSQTCTVHLPDNLADGAYILQVGARDNAGNWSVNASRTINVDRTAPAISTNLAENQYVSGNVNVVETVTDANPAAYNIRVLDNSGHVVSVTPGAYQSPVSGNTLSYIWNTKSIPDGVYKLQFSARDKAGNTTTIFVTVTVDNTKPTVTFTDSANYPEVNGVYSNDFQVKWAAHDAIALKTVNVDLFDTNSSHTNHWVVTCSSNGSETDTDDSGTCTVHLPALLPDGNYYVQVGAQDQAGNWSINAVRYITIDRTAPIVTVNTQSTTDTTPTITGTVDDSTAAVSAAVHGHLYAATVDTTANGSGTYAWSADVADPLPTGTYDVVATATDPAGNVGTDTTTNELTITTTPSFTQHSVTHITHNSAIQGGSNNNVNTSTNNSFAPQVLGANTNHPNNSNSNNNGGHVKGDSTTTPNTTTPVKNVATQNAAGKLFGLAWYWWTIIILALLAFIYATYRKAGTDKAKQQ